MFSFLDFVAKYGTKIATLKFFLKKSLNNFKLDIYMSNQSFDTKTIIKNLKKKSIDTKTIKCASRDCSPILFDNKNYSCLLK